MRYHAPAELPQADLEVVLPGLPARRPYQGSGQVLVPPGPRALEVRGVALLFPSH